MCVHHIEHAHWGSIYGHHAFHAHHGRNGQSPQPHSAQLRSPARPAPGVHGPAALVASSLYTLAAETGVQAPRGLRALAGWRETIASLPLRYGAQRVADRVARLVPGSEESDDGSR